MSLASLCVLGSVLALVAYEASLVLVSRKSPERVARTFHAEMRTRWVRALMVPLLVGIVAPLAMPVATVAWLVALRAFDRAPPSTVNESGAIDDHHSG